MYQIIHERPQDAAKIDPLLDLCFGPERIQKTAYKIRENLDPIIDLSLAAVDNDQLLATIRYWPVTIDEKHPALLLGPIAVQPSHQGEGIGVALIRDSLKLAAEGGHHIVILVGDLDYYARFGFSSAPDKGIVFPGPVDPARFLISALTPGALEGVHGLVQGQPSSKAANLPAKEEGLPAFSPPSEA